MNADKCKRKSLDVLFDESDQYEERLSDESDESAREGLINEIENWLRYCSEQGRFHPSASADRKALRSILDRWRYSLRKQGHFIVGVDDLANFDPDAGIPLPGDSPYPGLKPFKEKDHSSFFGRETDVSECVGLLRKQGNRILMIEGISGSGKSSVAMAGILPKLKEIYGETWFFGSLKPGQSPLKVLAEEVAKTINQPQGDIERMIADRPEKAYDLFANLCQNKPLMLFIDQFEELLTLCDDKDEQVKFAKALCSLSDTDNQENAFSCRILLTLRTDHLARLQETLSELHKRLSDRNNRHTLAAIGFDSVKRAIEEPAGKIGLRFIPPDLVNQLANQTTGLTAGLPLLQFALQRLWETRPRNDSGEPLDLITEKMVKGLPNVAGALGKVADELFKKLTDNQKKICDRLFLELLILDDNFEDPLRRRRNENAIKKVLLNKFNTSDDIDKVINAFEEPGLINRIGQGSTSQIEVAHEALLRNWGHIYNKVAGANAKERLHLIKQIGIQSNEWQKNNRSIDFLLLKGERLERAQEIAEDGWIAEKEAMEYIAYCQRREKDINKVLKFRKFMWSYVFFLLGVIIILINSLFANYVKSEYLKAEENLRNNKLAAAEINYSRAEFVADALKRIDVFEIIIDRSQVASIKDGIGKVYSRKPSKGKEFVNNNKMAIEMFKEAVRSENDSKYKNLLKMISYEIDLAGEYLRSNNPENIILAKGIYQGIANKEALAIDLKAKAQFGVGMSIVRENNKNTKERPIEHFEQALHNFPLFEIKSWLRELANAYMREKSFTKAIEYYELLVSKDWVLDLSLEDEPQSYITTLFGMAQAYSELNRLEDAEYTLKRIIDEFKNMPEEEAKALKRNNSSAGDAYFLLGTVQLKRNKYTESINSFKYSLEDRDKDVWVTLYLAEAYFSIGNDSTAEKFLSEAVILSKPLKVEQADLFFRQYDRLKYDRE